MIFTGRFIDARQSPLQGLADEHYANVSDFYPIARGQAVFDVKRGRILL